MAELPGVLVNVDIVDGTYDEFDIDLILANWAETAAYAFGKVHEHGRGLVRMTVTEDETTVHVDVEYATGIDCECHTEWVDSYCPMREVIVAVTRDGRERLYRLTGTPTPAEAYEAASTEFLTGTVH